MEYVLYAPRVGLVSANKEGIISVTGEHRHTKYCFPCSLTRYAQVIWPSISSACPQALCFSLHLHHISDAYRRNFVRRTPLSVGPSRRIQFMILVMMIRPDTAVLASNTGERTTKRRLSCFLTPPCGGYFWDSYYSCRLGAAYRGGWYACSSLLRAMRSPTSF